MTDKESNISQGGEASHTVDGVANVSVTSPNAALEIGSKESTGSALPLTQETGNSASVQSPSSRPLWNTRQGRIAGYRGMIEDNFLPEHRANLEALIRYYEEGGRVPEGYEEVWAVEGEASFGIRDYRNHPDQRPEGWAFKLKYCDTTKWCQMTRVPDPNAYKIWDAQGRVIL